MLFVRQSVWAKGGTFDDPILYWYAKGVAALKATPIADQNSWRFIAAIHGIDFGEWQQDGYYKPGEALPPQSDQDTFWNQCQHGTWYFLPWHRGYLVSLESILRDAIVKAGGPNDWALPYWDYSDASNPKALELPPAFSVTTMPDGSPNPLYVVQRYGAQVSPPTLPLPPNDVTTLTALNSPTFTGTQGGSPGFGGLKTAFSHSSGGTGALESKPHNIVHVDIGQSLSRKNPGLMDDPDLAGLDPIFFLHHANIDRLWSFWLTLANRSNPTDPDWLNGPVGGRSFVMPTANNGTAWVYTPQNVTDTTNIVVNGVQEGYTYSTPANNATLTTHLSAITSNRAIRLGATALGGDLMETATPKPPTVELIGANREKITVNAAAHTKVDLDAGMLHRVVNSFAPLKNAEPIKNMPDKIYLNLENIRANKEGIIIDVYINVPEGADPKQHPELHVESVALFGVKNASNKDLPHGGAGLTSVVEITDLVDTLHLTDQLSTTTALHVSLVPRTALPEDVKVTVDSISIYRESI